MKQARQLSCETFFGSMDAVLEMNWLKRVSNTLTDMELDDDLKLRVATRLNDKSACCHLVGQFETTSNYTGYLGYVRSRVL